jgi:hypothetical protein
MNFINFPESNMPLGSGGNENTSAMRVCVCEHPDYKKGTLFFASKWEFDQEERYRIREAIKQNLIQKNPRQGANSIPPEDMLDTIMEAIPNLWLTVMHQPPPVMITMMPPFYFGYVKKQLNLPQDN